MTTRFLLIVVMTVCLSGARADEQADGLSVIGQGVIRVPPATVTLHASVQASGDELEILKREVDERSMAVVRALTASGVGVDDYQATEFTVSQHQNYQTGELGRYRVRRDIEATVRKISEYGRVLDAIIAAGVTEVRVLRFSAAAEEGGLRRQALGAAIRNGREKAEHMAAAAEVTLGAMQSIEEAPAFEPMMNYFSPPEDEGRFIPNTIEERATVRLRFELR